MYIQICIFYIIFIYIHILYNVYRHRKMLLNLIGEVARSKHGNFINNISRTGLFFFY